MKKLISSIAVVAAVAVAVAFSPAAQAAKNNKGGKAAGQSCAGTIESVDTTASTVTVKAESGNKTFKVDALTKFATGTLADLKAGQEVMVKYTGSGEDLTATGIGTKDAHKAARGKKGKKGAE